MTQQAKPKSSILTLMPDEFIRFEYTYKPGCFCFSSKITTVTNMRLITQRIKPPGLFSSRTATGQEKNTIVFLTNIHRIEQIRSAIPSSRTQWWTKCWRMATCSIPDEDIDWLALCRADEACRIDGTRSTMIKSVVPEFELVEKF